MTYTCIAILTYMSILPTTDPGRGRNISERDKWVVDGFSCPFHQPIAVYRSYAWNRRRVRLGDICQQPSSTPYLLQAVYLSRKLVQLAPCVGEQRGSSVRVERLYLFSWCCGNFRNGHTISPCIAYTYIMSKCVHL